MSRFSVILPAAGSSTRFAGKEKKPMVSLDGRAIWLRTAELFVNRDDVCQTIVIVAADDMELFRQRYGANLAFLNISVVEGGSERFESVANALAEVSEEADLVAIHDAVRPCVSSDSIDAVFKQATSTGAAMLAVPVQDTIKRATDSQQIEATVPRRNLWLAQTPQVFRREWLIEAYSKRAELEAEITDDAQLIEAMGHAVHLVEGDPTNIKVTRKADLSLAQAILNARPEKKVDSPSHPFAEDQMW